MVSLSVMLFASRCGIFWQRIKGTFVAVEMSTPMPTVPIAATAMPTVGDSWT